MILLTLIFLIPLVLTLAIASGCWLDDHKKGRGGSYGTYLIAPLSIMGGVMLCLVGVIFTIMYISTTNNARDLETFHQDNSFIFLEATIEIKEGVRDAEGYFYDAARRDHITIYNGQVQEYKLNVIVYNKDLRRHIFWQNNMFMKGAYGPVGHETLPLPTLGFR